MPYSSLFQSYSERTVSLLKRHFYYCAVVFTFLLLPLSSHAQIEDKQKLAAIVSIINDLLLSGRELPIDEPMGDRVDITMGELVNGSFTVRKDEQVFAAFDLQETGIEFCFDAVGNTAFSSADVLVEVNGQPLSMVEGKDNCYQLNEPAQREINYIVIKVLTDGLTLTLNRLELASTEQEHLGLNRLTRGEWNQKAVRKVLRLLAFGGHATDAQIQLWADMDALDAIREMLTFEQHNLKLSPLANGEKYRRTAGSQDPQNQGLYPDIGTLTAWQNWISNTDPATQDYFPIPVSSRDQYGLDGYNFDDAYNRMITVRGLNPFRQKIGFWETNYHLAVNRDAGVGRAHVAHYYDVIMEAHRQGLPYYQVLAEAAKSAAVAFQYGHRFNEWDASSLECLCNDDFAREWHQLFFGIFGEGDPNHEDVTIPETAKLLTDMRVHRNNAIVGGWELDVDFQTDDHHVDPVIIYGQPIAGANASDKLDALAPISAQHEESLFHLPIMITEVLLHDNLSTAQKNQLRASWAAMGVERVFLDFIHAVAISDIIHNGAHVKYATTHERALYIANKHNLDNLEAFYGGGYYNGGRAGRTVGSIISDDFAGEFFRPIHNVFGAQSSAEASDSAVAFENNYNRLTDQEGDIRQSVGCSSCDLGDPWEKKWVDVLPQRADGNYYVKDVAEWLWRHVVGSFDHYTELERAHLYSLLGATYRDLNSSGDGDRPHDFNTVMCMIIDYQIEENATDAPILDILEGRTWDDYCRPSNDTFEPHETAALNAVYTGQQIANDPQIQEILNALGEQQIRINATQGWRWDPDLRQNVPDGGANLRRHSREAVSNALGFIFTTPFIFAEGQ